MRPLTPRQQEVLDLIKSTMLDTGMPPTRAEIARQLGFRSANAAEEHLKALAKKGVIEILPGTSRGIKLNIPLDDEVEEEGLPLIGRVAAGSRFWLRNMWKCTIKWIRRYSIQKPISCCV